MYDDKNKDLVIPDLTVVQVNNPYDVYSYVDFASKKRKTAATKMNEHSSRSHAVFTINVSIKQSVEDGDIIRTGKLNLVDLAGSECQGKTNSDAIRAGEAKTINTSLLTLGRVITALTEGSIHVPYRDSKLTRLLKESLGGRALSCIIATISPAFSSRDETVSTLDYTTKAKSIKNQPKANQVFTKEEQLVELEKKIKELQRKLDDQIRSKGIRIQEKEYDEMIKKVESQDKILEDKNKEHNDLSNALKDIENDLNIVETETKKKKETLDEEKEKENKLYNTSKVLLNKIKLSMNEIDKLFIDIDKQKEIDYTNKDVRKKIFEDMSKKYFLLYK